MRMITCALLVVLVGCAKKQEKQPKPEGTPGSGDVATPTPGSGSSAPATTEMSKLTCAKVVPPAMMDKYFKGAEVTEEVEKMGVQCTFTVNDLEKGGDLSISLLVWQCGGPGSKTSAVGAGKSQVEGAKDLPGIGRGAYQTSRLMGADESTRMFITQAWDDDTECYITFNGKDGAAVAKDTLAAVTPESLK